MEEKDTYLVPQRSQQIPHRSLIILSKFTQILNEDSVQPRVPIVTDDAECVRF